MTFSLQSDRVAVIADPLETKTESGIHLPENSSATSNLPRYGTVAVVGIGHRSEQTGERVVVDVSPGDRVFFHRASGEVWKIGDTEYLMLSAREIIGVSDGDHAPIGRRSAPPRG